MGRSLDVSKHFTGGNPIIYVDTIADLQALDTSGLADGQKTCVSTDERAGSFVWVSSNKSERVSEDPRSAVWVPPNGEDGSGGAWMRQYNGLSRGVLLSWFRHPGDEDDSDAIEAALSYGMPVYGGGGTFAISRELDLSVDTFALYEATVDTSAIPDTGTSAAAYGITVRGSQSSQIPVTSAIQAGDTVINVEDTSLFEAGGWFTVESKEIWDTTTGSRKGITLQAKEILSQTQISLTHPITYSFNLNSDLAVRVLTTIKNPIVQDVNFVGDSSKFQGALRCFYLEGGKFDRINSEGYGYGGISLSRCINTTVNNYKAAKGLTPGFSYGVVIFNACYGVTVKNGTGDDLRHYVTVGGTNGVNVNIKMVNNDCYNCRNSGLDSHPTGDFILYSGNTIRMRDNETALMHQGKNAIIVGNHIYGGIRSLRLQGLTVGESYTLTVGDNLFHAAEDGSTQQGVLTETMQGAGANIRALGLSNNTYTGVFSNSPMIIAANSGDVSNVSFVGERMDTPSGSRAISIRPQNGAKVSAVQISGCTLRTSGDYVIWLFGDAGGDFLSTINLSGNNLIGGNNSIYARFVNGLMDRGNLAVDFSSSKYNIGSSSNLDTEQ